MRKKLLLAFAPALLFAATAAEARTARCVVTSEGNPTWRGACNFLAERGGSFSITPLRGAFLEGHQRHLRVHHLAGRRRGARADQRRDQLALGRGAPLAPRHRLLGRRGFQHLRLLSRRR